MNDITYIYTKSQEQSRIVASIVQVDGKIVVKDRNFQAKDEVGLRIGQIAWCF